MVRIHTDQIGTLEKEVRQTSSELKTRTSYFEHISTLNSFALINARLSNNKLKDTTKKLIDKTENLERSIIVQERTIKELNSRIENYERLEERLAELERAMTNIQSPVSSPETADTRELTTETIEGYVELSQ